jgi:hypothetical protein
MVQTIDRQQLLRSLRSRLELLFDPEVSHRGSRRQPFGSCPEARVLNKVWRAGVAISWRLKRGRDVDLSGAGEGPRKGASSCNGCGKEWLAEAIQQTRLLDWPDATALAQLLESSCLLIERRPIVPKDELSVFPDRVDIIHATAKRRHWPAIPVDGDKETI